MAGVANKEQAQKRWEKHYGHIPVNIYLINGIKLQGQVESFDQYVVLLRNTVTQMVYKHAISTVVPTRSVTITNTPES